VARREFIASLVDASHGRSHSGLSRGRAAGWRTYYRTCGAVLGEDQLRPTRSRGQRAPIGYQRRSRYPV